MTRLLLFFATMLFFTACNKTKTIDEASPETKTLLKSYTRGMIYEDGEINFYFQDGVNLQSEDIQDAIEIKPHVPFDANINMSLNLLSIKPKQNLERGQEYLITLDMSKLTDKGEDLLVNTKVRIHSQNITVERKGVVIDKKGDRYLDINLSTALDESVEAIKNIFKGVSEDDVNVNKIESGKFSALIKLNAGESEIAWEGSEIGSSESGTLEVQASDTEAFKIVDTYFDKRDQVLTAYFSQLLKEDQDATGLILVGEEDKNYEIKNNTITVFVKEPTKEAAIVEFKRGIRSVKNQRLDEDYTYQLVINLLKPEIQWLSEGTYIPSEGDFKIPFKSKGLKQVKVNVSAINTQNAAQFAAWNDITSSDDNELLRYGKFYYEEVLELDPTGKLNLEGWNEFGIDLSDAFERETGYIYRIDLSYAPSYTVLSCNDEELNTFEHSVKDKDWFEDKKRWYNYYNNYNYKDLDNPCKPTFYFKNNGLSKNVHCTNVFPIIKLGENELVVALKNLTKNKNATGAMVGLLNLQGEVFAQEKMGTSGIVRFENLERKPHAIRVDFYDDISYFSLSEGKEVSITEFDISSNVSDEDNKLFVYSDRGVRRPGDTIVLNVMVNKAAFDVPEGIPVQTKIYNPKGVLVHTSDQPYRAAKLIYTFKFPTAVDDPTGYWQGAINIGPIEKTESIRVETIRPNVVDVTYSIRNESEDWVYDNKLAGSLNVAYFAGYAMKNGNVKATATVMPLKYPWDKWKNYSTSSYDKPDAEKVELMNVTTDQNGEAQFSSLLDFKNFKTVSRVIMDSQIDLPGGGANSEVQVLNISPYKSYVGIEEKSGKGWWGSFRYDEMPRFALIHLNEKGTLLKGKTTAQATLYRAKQDWWYDRYRLSRDYRVVVGEHFEKVETLEVSFNDGEGRYEHKEGLPSGIYVLQVKDPESGHTAQYRYHAVSNRSYSVQANPEFLELNLEKKAYNAGEHMSIDLPQLPESRALITIERGTKILEAFWMDLTTPTLELKVEDAWFPNFYLNVNIVQNYQQKHNDRPIRLYTVEKITVNERTEVIEPVLNTPAKVRPNETFNVQVSEKQGKAMEYTLTVVDRGLLNITGFKTPDPLTHFNQQYALLIKTWDLVKDLMVFMDPSFSGVFSIGGDAALKQLDKSADFNRFEPVVFNIGPFKLPAGATKSHKITLPNYIGNLSVSVVAASPKTFGNEEQSVIVASPLMVQTQMPRSLNVTDEVILPVTLFKDDASIKNVEVTAESNQSHLAFAKNKTSVGMSDDQALANLAFTVKNQSGETDLKIKAKANGYETYEDTKIFVNYPNSYEEKVTYYKIPTNGQQNIDIDASGYDETKHVSLSLSGIILPAFTDYYASLIDYPYGCLEQTTSRGLAMLFMGDLIKLSAQEKTVSADHLDAAIDKIFSYQSSQGRFSYWSNGYYHEWSDLYAGHFLLEAKEKGHKVNNTMLNNWKSYTTGVASKWRADGLDGPMTKRAERLQAYRLFLLAKANTPDKSAMNRFRNRALDNLSKVLLAGAYHYTGMEDVAAGLFYDNMNVSSNYDYYTFGSDVRNEAIVLMVLSLLEEGERVDRYYEEWVRAVNDKSWLTTQDKGFIMMAAHKYLGDPGSKLGDAVKFSISSQTHTKSVQLASNTSENISWSPQDITDQASISNTSEGPLFVIKTERAIPTELYQDAYNDNLSMNVDYSNLNGGKIDLMSMQQGEEILITVNIKNTDVVDHNSLALNVKMPSGWELINPRLIGSASTTSSDFNYQNYRDDRVYTFFGINQGGSKVFRFRAKANLKGDYYLPAVSCEHMYLRNVRAQNKAARVKIE